MYVWSKGRTMNETQQYLAEEFLDEYRAERMSRRAMFRRVTLLLGGATAAAAWLHSQGLSVSAREAATAASQPIPPEQTTSGVTVSPEDPAITVMPVEFAARDGATLFGYLAAPANAMAPSPGIVVLHENQGLTEHYRDLARRYAMEGFTGLAVDLLSRAGGTDSAVDRAAVGAALAATPIEQHVLDLSDYVTSLLSQPSVVPSGAGATGFCFGGSRIWRLAVEDPNVAAAVPYYGSAPPLDKIPQMRAAVLGIYGGLDERVNATIPPLEDALRSAGKTYRIKIFEGAAHAFFNDADNRPYHPAAAREAWADTLAWFRQYLPMA